MSINLICQSAHIFKFLENKDLFQIFKVNRFLFRGGPTKKFQASKFLKHRFIPADRIQLGDA